MKENLKKMRLQLFDKEFNQVEDRLVSQDTELYKGVKELWEGPLKVEVCLFQKSDVETFKEYLDKLVGNLPLDPPKKKRGRTKFKVSSPSYREELAEMVKKEADMGTVVANLKETGFIFTSVEFLKDLGLPIAMPEDLSYEDYRWLVKLTRKAKNPLRNKYDVSVLVGVQKFKKDKVEFVVVSAGELLVQVNGIAQPKDIKVPPRFKVKFPHFLTPDERVKLSLEIGELRKEGNKDQKPSPLYRRWIWAVAKENEDKGLDFPRLESIPNPYK